MREHDSNQRRAAWALTGLGMLIFAGVGGFAFRRHLHVDEIQSLYSIQLCGSFGRPDFMLPVDLFAVALSPIARHLPSSLALFVTFRGMFLAGLLGLCVGVATVQRALPSPLGKATTFLSAVLFGPLFRHGFEVRHDLFVALAVVVLFWACERARTQKLTFRDESLTAATVVLAQSSSIKAFSVCAPALILCALLYARGNVRPKRAFALTLLRFVPGALGGSLLVAGTLACFGALGPFISYVRYYLTDSLSTPFRLSPVPLLGFAVASSPGHALLVLFGLFAVATRIISRKPLGEALVPICFFAITLASSCLNPTLFPYNFTWIAPSLIWMTALGISEAQRWLYPSKGSIRLCVNAMALLVGLGCLLHAQLDPYFRKTWDEQLRVVRAAETLTPPNQPVVDLTGLVVSRPAPARDWLVHGLLMADYRAGRREKIGHIVERIWPAVVVGGHYRWDFVDPADRHVIAQNYVPISPAIWVLGSVIDGRTHSVEVHRAGRYLAIAAHGEKPLGTVDARVVAAGNVLTLASGSHAIVSEPQQWQLAWLGGAQSMPDAAISRPLFEEVVLPGQL